MAYRDPYMEHPTSLQQQGRYNDSAAEYDPYPTSYDHGRTGVAYNTYGPGYSDNPHLENHYLPDQLHRNAGGTQILGGSKEANLEVGSLSSPEKRSTSALKNYRYEYQGALWTKGGRVRCVGRFCCCTIMIIVLLFLSIVLSLALWIRPPNITVGKVNTVSQNGSAIELVQDGIQLNLGINISVNNPNFFSVKFKEIQADIFYPIDGTTPQVGHGSASDVVFGSHQLTNWTFPFTIDYKLSTDPQFLILKDLAAKCGVGGQKTNLDVQYKIKLGLQIFFITISPTVSNSLSFMCPIDPSDIEALLKSTGLGAAIGI